MSPGQRRLDGKVEAVRTHLEARTWWATAAWGTVAVVLLLVAAWILAGPEGWRQGSNFPVALVVGFAALALVGVGLVRAGVRRWFAEAPLSRVMEEAAGLDEGAVRGLLELGRSVPPGVSAALAGRAAEVTLTSLGGSATELSGDLGRRVRTWVRRGTGTLVLAVVLAVGLAVLAPRRTAAAWSGLLRPFSLMVDPVLPPLVVTPGSVEVRRGEDVDVRVEAQGRRVVAVSWQEAGEVAHTVDLALESGAGVHRFPAVTASLEYRVGAPDGSEAGPFRIQPVDPLFVSDLRVEVEYPPHTGLRSEEYRGEVPPLSLPAGTRLVVEGRTNRPLREASLTSTSGDGTSVAFERDEVRFSGSWRPRSSGVFEWVLLDREGAPAEIRPEPLDITLEDDEAPSIAIPLPGRDTILPVNLRQPLVLEARDDYGLARLELVAYRVTAVGTREEPRVQTLELGGTRAARARPVLDLGGWGLLPGDTVRYFARVSDNHPPAQESRTREYVLRMPDAAEMRREAERRIGEVGSRMEELAREAAEQAEETRDMERSARSAPEADRSPPPGRPQPSEQMGFEEREELRRALEGQKQLTGEVDSLQTELRELQDAMTEAGQADPELSADLEELQRLLEEAAGEEMREQMERLSESLEGERPRGSDETLEEMAQEQEAFKERLEQSLERFRRAAVDQDFRATQSEAEELARREEALADALEEGDDPALRAGQQDDLAARTEELEARMETLQERLQELEEDAAAAEVDEARDQAAEAREQMTQAGDQARQDARQRSGDNARSGAQQAQAAAQQMQQAAQDLSQAQQQMAAEKARAAQEALRSAADEALSLARSQGGVREAMGGAGREELVEMRADEASLLQGVQNMAQNLQSASEGALAQNRELSIQMGRAMASVERTVEAMGNARGSAPSPQAAADQAVASLNQLALTALSGAEQMSQNQQGQGQSSPQQTGEQLQELAQQQGEVNNQSSQLTPMQLGRQALQEQLQRLAQEQQAVADELERMREEPGTEESALGDVEALAREAEELAREMAGGRSPDELRERQENLFRRLLDSGRSLEREEFSDERESAAAGEVERTEVVPLTEDELGAMRFRIPDADELQSLPPALRQLVLQYFERLNRAPDTGGSR